MMHDKLIEIPESDYRIQAIRSSGPGGQHANKVSTAIQIQYDIHNSSLSDQDKQNLLKYRDNRISTQGVITITAKRYRSQSRNREDAVIRLRKLVTEGIEKPKPRKKMRTPKASKEKRLQEKARKSEIKKMREKPDW